MSENKSSKTQTTISSVYSKNNASGKVWLVGFGPGNPDLLTIKALKLLEKCDIIFHDDLLDKDFINQFKAEKVYVGKRKDNHSYEQSDINKALLNSALIGKMVVRLKGGDPMLFAHGGEEIEYLESHNIETEVVPGITAGLAASALAKIPLTHRGISSSVTFITGHVRKQMNMPTSGTIVYYMSASNITNIASQAIKKGWRSDTPVLLAYNISGNDQELIYTTLGDIQNQPKIYKTPLIIVIGNVVRLKNNQSADIMKPTFLVTGTNAEKFNKYGDVIHMPLIELARIKDLKEIQEIIKNLNNYKWIIFSSRHAVIYFMEVLENFNLDVRSLAGISIASIGQITTAELKKTGIIPEIQSSEESSEGLVKMFLNHDNTGENILIPGSDIALKTLPRGLANLGYNVFQMVVYTNKMPSNVNPVPLTKIDYIVFSSPSCVVNFFNIYKTVADNILLIVQGKETRKKLIEYPIIIENIRDQNYLETLHTY